MKNPPAMQWTQEMRVRNSNPLQYSCLGNPMDREAQRATVHELDARHTHTHTHTHTWRLGREVVHTCTHTHTLGGWAGRWHEPGWRVHF